MLMYILNTTSRQCIHIRLRSTFRYTSLSLSLDAHVIHCGQDPPLSLSPHTHTHVHTTCATCFLGAESTQSRKAIKVVDGVVGRIAIGEVAITVGEVAIAIGEVAIAIGKVASTVGEVASTVGEVGGQR
jgi:hypothetical protein